MFRLLSLAALLLAACLPARAAPGPAWHPFECPWRLESARAVECGVLEVPENWARADSRTILLHVRILRAPKPYGLPPVIYLSGGPGQDMAFTTAEEMEDWLYYAEAFMGWAEGRDIILFSQRGILVDGVGMECPELGDPRTYLGAAETPDDLTDPLESLPRAEAACRARLAAEGYDLAAYTTTQSARDVAALREALGIPEWVLFGVSYGSRLGLTLMRNHPEGVAAAIFDSVFPPEITDHWHDASAFAQALDTLFANCARMRRCARAYPGLESRLDALLARLAREPLVLWVEDRSGENPRLYIKLDDVLLLDMIFFKLYWIDDIEELPRGIDALDRGDIDLFRELIASDYVFDTLFYGWSYGMQTAITCNDDHAWFDPGRVRTEMRAFPRFANWLGASLLLPSCGGWPAQPRDSGFSAPVASGIPTLLLTGEYDPVTPPRYAERALAHLPNGRLVVVRGVAHAVLDAAPCARALVREFLAAPARALPATCGLGRPPIFALP
ncbi:MAG TPA: alpha/beta hydrolase [Paracoccaceae bacterium]|nr:alpha/beta hydrolase [Paracoccaceae bacterium]